MAKAKLVLQEKQEKALRIIRKIIRKASELEKQHESMWSKVLPVYRDSARNLIHYLAFRSFDIDRLQTPLRELGLPSLTNVEGHIMHSLLNQQYLLESLLDQKRSRRKKGFVTIRKSENILNKNTKQLFGYKSKQRSTRIMVTLPNTAAEDAKYVRRLVSLGMNCARINCAHDDMETWRKMIAHVHDASKALKRKCKVAMDLGGPKLRTGPMVEGPKVIHIRPKKDDRGRVTQPSRIWIAPPDVLPPANREHDAVLPVDDYLFSKIKRGSTLHFTDARRKKCKISIEKKEGPGKWGLCSDSAYLETGMQLTMTRMKETGEEVSRVGELLPKEQFITLFASDRLIVHRDPRPGENAVYGPDGQLVAPAHISCTLPEVFEDIKPNEPIYFDDGKIEGVIETVSPDEMMVQITQARDRGSKLRADKGINLPESVLTIGGLTDKDRSDLDFVAEHADVINYSFVNRPKDVKDLYELLNQKGSQAGIILKIETQEAFAQLPGILLAAMKRYPLGVMIARGDLAIETGWKNFASIQQEIMRICAAAHLPSVWATQVLESMAKKGIPSRAEITDAAIAEQAECVMLNKGFYI
ncbi:MAG: pyruvate kinase, partial [Saprospiraceae bacterium]|nr:pyruvate kinase [Saprospiraceae bacterium]